LTAVVPVSAAAPATRAPPSSMADINLDMECTYSMDLSLWVSRR
jgi:hypothetical protein